MLVESLTGDHRRYFHTNRLLRMSRVRPVDEPMARLAAKLRFQTGRANRLAATDAVVVAFATKLADARILTSDPDDIRALADVAPAKVTVVQV